MHHKPDITKMTLREKIHQTVVYLMEKGKSCSYAPGAAFFFGTIITEADAAGIDELRGHVDDLFDRCTIPPLITSDFENGCGSMVKSLTPLPCMMALGAAHNESLAYDYGKATALEARYIGANWTFSPICDLNINPRNPLINTRGLTDDPELACRLISQVVRGMQDHDIAACAKHFPGDGVDYRDQHITTTKNSLSMAQWCDTFGKTYKTLIDAGVKTVMAGHITLPAYPQTVSEKFGLPLPATLNRHLITDLLKGELGFDGIVVTDALDMGGFKGWFASHEQAEIEAFKAGCDMMLWPSEHYPENLEKAISAGEVPMSRLDDAVTRILNVKEQLGLFREDFRRFREMSPEEKEFVKNVQIRCGNESTTLLRDGLGAFPLDPQTSKRLGILAITEHLPALEEARTLKREFEKRGFAVDYRENTLADQTFFNRNDYVICAPFSRPFRPKGFIDYLDQRASCISSACCPDGAPDKLIVASFGSPYFCGQYFEKAQTAVNCYSMLACQAEAFVRAACGEVPFTGRSPVTL